MSAKKVMVLSGNRAWNAAIVRLDFSAKVECILDFEDLYLEAAACSASVACIEVTAEKLDFVCQNVAALSQNPFQLKMIAIANPSLMPAANLLKMAGFCTTVWSFTEIERIKSVGQRHFQTVYQPDVSLEARIESNLPWARATE